MTHRHKNAEYIIAFANGEEVEWKYDGLDFALDEWKPINHLGALQATNLLLRMKPKTVKTKGYKRYAWQDGDFEWHVGTFSEGECVASCGVVIDKEWQYHVIEEKE